MILGEDTGSHGDPTPRRRCLDRGTEAVPLSLVKHLRGRCKKGGVRLVIGCSPGNRRTTRSGRPAAKTQQTVSAVHTCIAVFW